LGSIQWTIIASNLRETSYAVSSLSKGARYAFRVLAGTGKAFSKPSPPTDLVQLIDRGTAHSFCVCVCAWLRACVCVCVCLPACVCACLPVSVRACLRAYLC